MRSEKVGSVFVTVGLANINSEDFIYEKALVDTGANETAIPTRIAKALGVKVEGKVKIRTANGPVAVDIGFIKMNIEGNIRGVSVWISDKVDKVLIGVVSLEHWGLKVNPVKERLEKDENAFALYALEQL